jgi:glycosyltransferase involved in cell wall biosynthesis
MRFTFISSMEAGPWGGSEELWSQTALRLHKEGHRVSACMLRWLQPSPKFLALGEEGIRLHTQPRFLPLSARTWNKLTGQRDGEYAWIKRQKPDLAIISQGGNADGLRWMELCRELRIPYVAVVQCNAEQWWPLDSNVDRLAAAYRAALLVACVSRGNLEMLERQIVQRLPNATVIWNPFEVPLDQPPGWPRENGVCKMACVARLDPSAKGQDLLFQVLQHPRWKERPVEMNLYGAGLWGDGLHRLAESLELENVHFHGHVNDVRTIWKQNHILVLPSRYEGLPLALVEAMWCGRPAVVTDVAGNAEVCVDGETGFVAAAPTAKLLEETLERAWNNRHDWQRMGLAARARAEKLIPKDPVGNFCRLLQETAAASHPARAGVFASQQELARLGQR